MSLLLLCILALTLQGGQEPSSSKQHDIEERAKPSNPPGPSSGNQHQHEQDAASDKDSKPNRVNQTEVLTPEVGMGEESSGEPGLKENAPIREQTADEPDKHPTKKSVPKGVWDVLVFTNPDRIMAFATSFLALATFLLVGATIMLAIYTRKLWQTAKTSSMTAHEGLILNRRAFYANHPPRLKIGEHFTYGGRDSLGDHRVNCFIVNVGRSLGILIDARLSFGEPDPQLLGITRRDEITHEFFKEIYPGNTVTVPISVHGRWTEEGIRGILAGERRAHIIGELTFQDTIGKLDREPFELEYNPTNYCFEPVDNPDYKYEYED